MSYQVNDEIFSRLKFDNEKDRAFSSELKSKVTTYLKNQSNSSKGSALSILKLIVLYSSFIMCWYQLAFLQHSLLSTILIMAIFSLTYIAMAFTIGHDAGHNSMFKSQKINNFVFWITYNLLGIPPYIWRFTHNHIHHHYVNIPGHDIDIEKNPVLRLTPLADFEFYHRYQWIYALFLYPFFFFNKFFANDFRTYYGIEKRYFKNIKHPFYRSLEHVFFKLLYLSIMVGIPTLFSGYSFTQVLLGYCAIMMTISFFIAFTLAGSHLNLDVSFIKPTKEGHVSISSMEHQIITCIDFHPESFICGFICGGINAHTAHHLFPSINSIHYPALTRIIRETCFTHGIAYKEKNIFSLWISHYKYLILLSRDSKRQEALLAAGLGQK